MNKGKELLNLKSQELFKMKNFLEINNLKISQNEKSNINPAKSNKFLEFEFIKNKRKQEQPK